MGAGIGRWMDGWVGGLDAFEDKVDNQLGKIVGISLRLFYFTLRSEIMLINCMWTLFSLILFYQISNKM